ncbi:hypothetical protein Srubr_52350 [Streptomyces rubradiris]|uniref:Uncharacterized protein n=1 Tax=Streptomyces rubradiris TaxID=285531 RepID=A0ABQ3RHU6_STRRR|nr:hypothetical protein GCM10018792_77500 [Streptomyces rubradiris]GHI55389.1 hypothetical protein Srubr_52350 [Streptomyces rubradiris]
MSVGSTLAYEPTHSIATKGATRHKAMITLTGVTTGGLTSGVPDMPRLRPLADHLCNEQEI